MWTFILTLSLASCLNGREVHLRSITDTNVSAVDANNPAIVPTQVFRFLRSIFIFQKLNTTLISKPNLNQATLQRQTD
jgi:hypothetical protein